MEKKNENTNHKFSFNLSINVSIDAENLPEALKLLDEQFPGIKKTTFKNKNTINDIQMDNQSLGCTYSPKAGGFIWYLPGCPYGKTGCIFDPMREIAEDCVSQEDLQSRKHDMICSEYDDEDDSCGYYDDESK